MRVTVENGTVVARIQLRETVEEYGVLLQLMITSAAPQPPSRSVAVEPVRDSRDLSPEPGPEQAQQRYLMAMRIQRFIRAYRAQHRLPVTQAAREATRAVTQGSAPGAPAPAGDEASAATSPWTTPIEPWELRRMIRIELRSMARDAVAALGSPLPADSTRGL